MSTSSIPRVVTVPPPTYITGFSSIRLAVLSTGMSLMMTTQQLSLVTSALCWLRYIVGEGGKNYRIMYKGGYLWRCRQQDRWGCLSCLQVFRPKFVPSAASIRRPICTSLHVSDIYKCEDCRTKLRLETQAFYYMRSFFLDYPESGDRIPHKKTETLSRHSAILQLYTPITSSPYQQSSLDPF